MTSTSLARLSRWFTHLNFQQALVFKPLSSYSNSSMEIPSMPLSDELSIPRLGFGTGTAWFKEGGEGPLNTNLIETLKAAIDSGLNHIDCADSYGTEAEVGIALRESGVSRETMFITTKVLDNIADIPHAIDQSLSKMQLDYVDLYLIHTPYYTEDPTELQRAWKAMEEVKKSGKARSIGVSNFQRPHVESILKVASITPAVNQLEFHPYLQRANGYVPWMKERGIAVSAFKGLAPITVAKGGPLDATLKSIAENHGVDVGSVLLRWHIQQDIVPITTTEKKERMASYLKAVTIELTAAEMEEITKIGLSHPFRWWGTQFFAQNDLS